MPTYGLEHPSIGSAEMLGNFKMSTRAFPHWRVLSGASPTSREDRLVATQGNQGIDSGSPLCRNVTGEQRNHREQEGNPGESEGIGGFHPK